MGSARKWVTRDKIGKVMAGSLKMPLSTLAFDVWGRDAEEWVFDSGDGDGWCAPDQRTLFPAPWLKRPTGQVLMSMNNIDGSPCSYDPRYMLQGLMDRFDSLGLTPVIAVKWSFTFYIQRRTVSVVLLILNRIEWVVRWVPGQTYGIDLMEDEAELMHEIHDACHAKGLPVDTLIKESAPSQYEINLYHNNDAVIAADQAVMHAASHSGRGKKHGLIATFMAKPFGDIAGNGMHVHCSLVDQDGNNMFDDASAAGTPLLRQAIAGCLDMMADSMLLFAPNLNSYRRFPPRNPRTYGALPGVMRIVLSRSVFLPIHQQPLVSNTGSLERMPIRIWSWPGFSPACCMGSKVNWRPPHLSRGMPYEQVPANLPRYWPDALQRFEQSEYVPIIWGPNSKRCLQFSSNRKWTLLTVK